MAKTINLESLLAACADDSFDDGIRIDTELEPLLKFRTFSDPTCGYGYGAYRSSSECQRSASRLVGGLRRVK